MTEPHFHGQAGVRIAGTGLGLPEGRLTNADPKHGHLRRVDCAAALAFGSVEKPTLTMSRKSAWPQKHLMPHFQMRA